MVKKYQFGTPIETEAVVQALPCESGQPAYGTITVDTAGFRFDYKMTDGTAVYGLGEAMRGINKRGGLYVSYNLDHSFHMEDVLSLYASHNFILLAGESPVGLFFDYPGKITFDIGHVLCLRRHDTYDNLAHEFNVCKRTIRYDVAALMPSWERWRRSTPTLRASVLPALGRPLL